MGVVAEHRKSHLGWLSFYQLAKAQHVPGDASSALVRTLALWIQQQVGFA